MELKNKIDWQVKNLQECGLKIEGVGRNEFHVIDADLTNFSYYWTSKEPKTFIKTSKNGKEYKVLAWKFDNVSKWVSIPTFKKIMVNDEYLIALDKKFTKLELINELDQAAKGYDDVEPFIMKNDIYIKSVASNNKDITKLNDAIIKNNADLDEEEKASKLQENKIARKEAKITHKAKMEKMQEDIASIRKQELIKEINDLQKIAVEKINGEEVLDYLDNENNLNLVQIETYIDLINNQNFEKPFLTNSVIIYLVNGIRLIANLKNLTLNERHFKIDQFLLEQYNKKIANLNN